MKSQEKRAENHLQNEKLGRAQADAKKEVQRKEQQGRSQQDMRKDASGSARKERGSGKH